MFKHLVEAFNYPSLVTEETAKGRFYHTPQGNRYPSITTILGAVEKPFLKDWRNMLGDVKADKEMKRCADRGTAVHDMVEKFLKNVDDPCANHSYEHIREFTPLRPFLNKIDNIYAQEVPLWSDVLQAAGRVDCIGEYDGKLSVIDFKTSTNDKKQLMIGDYFLQATAYAIMFQERHNIQVDNIVILMSTERGIIPLVFQESVEKFVPELVTRIAKYHKTHKM